MSERELMSIYRKMPRTFNRTIISSSRKNDEFYEVYYDARESRWKCICPDFVWRDNPPDHSHECKHIRAVKRKRILRRVLLLKFSKVL